MHACNIHGLVAACRSGNTSICMNTAKINDNGKVIVIICLLKI